MTQSFSLKKKGKNIFIEFVHKKKLYFLFFLKKITNKKEPFGPGSLFSHLLVIIIILAQLIEKEIFYSESLWGIEKKSTDSVLRFLFFVI